MVKIKNPIFKLSRRLGVNIYRHPNAMKRPARENSRERKIVLKQKHTTQNNFIITHNLK